MRNLLYLLLFSATLFTTACGSDDDGVPDGPLGCTSEAYNNAITANLQEISDALTAYSNDPTTANCDAYRQTLLDYVDDLEKFDGCAAINQTNFRQQLEDAREEINNSTC